MKNKKLVVAVPLEKNLLSALYHWGKNFDFSEVEKVHFIHIVKKNVTPLEFGLMESPDEATFREMVPTLEKFLRDEAKKILPHDFQGEVTYQVESNYHPEDDFIELLQISNTDLLIVATHGRHGLGSLFHSSFTEYMVKHAPCDVFVVRPRPEEPETLGTSF